MRETVHELLDNASSALVLLCRAEDREQELVGAHTDPAAECWRDRFTECHLQHRADEVDSRVPGVRRFDKSGIHVDDERPLRVQDRIA